MNTLGVIGSGEVGTAVARLAVAAGMDVVLANSRGPETLDRLVDSLGDTVRASTVTELVSHADVVLLAVPLRAVRALGVDLLAGKVVLDASNYYPERDGAIVELDRNDMTTCELDQKHLAGARIVKAFNTIGAHVLNTLARPHGATDRSALPVASDDQEAKEATVTLLDRLGFDAVDVGGLAGSWRIEPNAPAYVVPYLGEVVELRPANPGDEPSYTTSGARVGADELRDLVARAVRGPAGGEWPKGRPTD